MYTDLKNTQIVIALLKKYNIRHIVISPGTRNGPFVISVERDSFFHCYSVVDERSAAFFALGIARQLCEPVVISCTSSTAACNYYSAVAEAFYSHIPLVVLTSDRSPQFRNQMEKQQIEQVNMYGAMCRKFVDLPMDIRSKDDFWYCERLVNEALLELTHHEGGPVQINLPVYYNMQSFKTSCLPEVKRIFRNELREPYTRHELDLALELHNTKKIMLQIGACSPWDEWLRIKAQTFMKKYNCIIVDQHLSNTGISDALNITSGVDIGNCLQNDPPELLITMGGPTQLSYMEKLRSFNIKHWLVNKNGEVQDPTRHLTEIFEVSIGVFFDFFNAKAEAGWHNDFEYNAKLHSVMHQFESTRPALEHLTNIYAIRELCRMIPERAMLCMSILNSIRITESFPLAKNVDAYANVGAYGIDGCMSTFLGQATVIDRPAYLVIGDLSFFYDMNSLWIRHVSENVHIFLVNNYEGIEMRRSWRGQNNLRQHITAGHYMSPKEWIKSNGFQYYSASNVDELNMVIKDFVNEKRKCVLEVFTNGEDDTAEAYRFFSYSVNGKGIKTTLKKVLGEDRANKIKSFFGK